MGLKINQDNTKYLVIFGRTINDSDTIVGNHSYLKSEKLQIPWV